MDEQIKRIIEIQNNLKDEPECFKDILKAANIIDANGDLTEHYKTVEIKK